MPLVMFGVSSPRKPIIPIPKVTPFYDRRWRADQVCSDIWRSLPGLHKFSISKVTPLPAAVGGRRGRPPLIP